MALTDTFVRQTKASGKHADGQGLYVLVSASGKYWRMDYRYADKRRQESYFELAEVRRNYPNIEPAPKLTEAQLIHSLGF